MEFSIQLRDDVHSHARLPAVQDYFLKYEGQQLVLPDRWHPQPEFFGRRLAMNGM